MSKQRLLLAVVCVLASVGFSGCELAGLGEVGAAGEAAAVGEGAAAVGSAEIASLGRAAFAGDVAAMSRLGAVEEGVVIGESEAAVLGRSAAARAATRLGLGAPLAEEVALVRAGARVLSYSDDFPVARLHDLKVKLPDNSILASIRRFENSVVIRNGSGDVVGESVIEGSKILHYTDATRSVLRGYSTLEGTTLRHWIIDSTGQEVYFGSEIVRPRSGVPPDTIAIPPALVAGVQPSSKRSDDNPASVDGASSGMAQSKPPGSGSARNVEPHPPQNANPSGAGSADQTLAAQTRPRMRPSTAEVTKGLAFVLEDVQLSQDQELVVSGKFVNRARFGAQVYAGVSRDTRYNPTPQDQNLQVTAIDDYGNSFSYESASGFRTDFTPGYWANQAGRAGYLGKTQSCLIEPGETAPVTFMLKSNRPVTGSPKGIKVTLEFRVLAQLKAARCIDKTVRFSSQ